MLEYEWGNPSSIMLSGEQTAQDSEQNRSVFDQYATQNFTETANFINQDNHFATATATAAAHHNHFHLPFHHPQTQNINTHLTNFYHSNGYGASASSYPHHHAYPASMLSLEPAGFLMMPKSEPVVGELDFNDEFSASASRIGLNLGGRTYFASSEDDFVNRLYRRSRILESGSANSPRCQAEGCKADLTNAKHYHRRHKVCEFHSKAATVLAGGMTQRFCQQCSRFHVLSEFDNGKRSCRKRLADHNRRRRKSQHPNQDKSRLANNALNSSSENLARSPPESEPHSSSVTLAISPPRISLDCFGHRSNYNMTNVTASSTASTRISQLFYSNG